MLRWLSLAASSALALALVSSSACGEGEGPAAQTDAGTMSSTITGTIGFLEPCTTNEECMTGLCYRYNMATVGLRCTKTCTGPADCPAPSSGCNNMGVCKQN